MARKSKITPVLDIVGAVEGFDMTVSDNGIASYTPTPETHALIVADMEAAGFVMTEDGAVDVEASLTAMNTEVTCELPLENPAVDEAVAEVVNAEAVTITEAELDELLNEFGAGIEVVGETLEASEPEAPEGWSEIEGGAEEPSDDDQAPDEAEDFTALMAQVEDDTIDFVRDDVRYQFETRLEFELRKDPNAKDKIGASLGKSEKKLSTMAAATVLVAASVDPNFINGGSNAGGTYNVYAIDKVADLVQALAGAGVRNAINNAITRSLFKFRAAGVTFTGEMAKAAASSNIKVDKAMQALLVRHTVAPSTAPTQASSTMQALQTLGIVRNVGTQKFPAYALTDTPATRRLEEVLARAA